MLLKTETYTDKNGIKMLKSYYGYVDDNGNEVIKGKYTRAIEETVSAEPATDPVMDKLNSIETRLDALASDSITVENVTNAILEGVNEV